MNSLLAISVDPSDLDFGSLYIGDDTGTTDYTKAIVNTGNVAFDIAINPFGSIINDGKSMDCSPSGSLDDSNLKYSLVASTDYSTKTSLTSDATLGTQILTFDLAEQTSGSTGSTKNVYFGMGLLPTDTVSGDCSGNLQITAMQN